MAKYKIFVDTGADMPEEVAKEKGIGIIRFLSIFGEDSYVSGVDLTNKEFFKKLEESDEIPTTSQTPYQDLYDILKDAPETKCMANILNRLVHGSAKSRKD